MHWYKDKTITEASKPQPFKVTECLSVLKAMWDKPKITELVISSTAWYKLTAYINLVGDYEITGFGKIEEATVDGKKTMAVTDIDIIDQEVKSAFVEAEDDAIIKFIQSLPEDQRDKWTLDWHSHVSMSTSPSGTDWDNWSDMLKARMNKQFPAMIINKQGEVTAYQIISDLDQTKIKVLIEKNKLDEDTIINIYNECKTKVEKMCKKADVSYRKLTEDDIYKPLENTVSNTWFSNDSMRTGVYDDDVCSVCGAALDKRDSRAYEQELCPECYDRYFLGIGGDAVDAD